MATVFYQHVSILFLLCFFFFLCFCAMFSAAAARSSITTAQFIRNRDNLISDGNNFEMGFFTYDNYNNTYVGIWYYTIPQPYVIWVANRDYPVKGDGGAITIQQDGNLVIFDGQKRKVWSSNVTISANNKTTEAVLGDDGNLVLTLTDSRKKVWQSFEDPSDTYLPGMKVPANPSKGKNNFVFTSWKSAKDPSPGKYTMGVDPESLPQIVVWEAGERRWRSGYWNGGVFTGVDMTGSVLNGFTINKGDKSSYFSYSVPNGSDKVRFQITWDGYEKDLKWDPSQKQWNETQKGPSNDCEVYNKCGSFSACDISSGSPVCKCLRGFQQRGGVGGGCKRVTPLKAEKTTSQVGVKEDGFKRHRCLRLPDFAQQGNPVGAENCESFCLQNSSCTAYAEVSGIGCMVWYGELVDLQDFRGNVGETLFIRLAASDLEDGGKKNKVVIVTAIIAGLISIGIFVFIVWRCKAKLKLKAAVSSASCRKNSDVIPIYDASKSKEMSTEFSASADLSLEGNELSGPELPLFNFNCISIATDNFSQGNKLGEGGFGPVYKGKLPSGEQIAVKRLSRHSCQGLEEFKNEMMLIAKLQHRNLVRQMGCSIRGEEKLLVYEYMPNKSLDRFLFDPVKQTQLDWARRYDIIEGIARGLLYLHRDSRLRIIHRDLKASNILLDENMNPKISDFGLARIFGGNQNEGNTTRVVGTYGYMAPEYAMEGLFSVKSDVYSFGVLLLEIVSGRRNTSFRHSDDTSLIGYAWHLWNEGRAMELVDPCIRESSPKDKALRCINIGMLCVQDSASHRPNMSNVVLMLESETTTLPLPSQPLVTSMRRSEDREFHMEGLDVSNDLTVTMVVGR
ncbi:G-type lectin S-receptor-like serine/threonine-protein kinase B120 isoform X1 [Arachis duranensis]|uniref:Receptor-like serine/threonine-protein kinase n=2 Tax=Arachis TaxID=3817 RepID=A0A6P4C8J3_ARADU|nr:G-type lectin S-receptor-like serine/threonine-protein kinase B120 isoform X1 [Arachis duranensis]